MHVRCKVSQENADIDKRRVGAEVVRPPSFGGRQHTHTTQRDGMGKWSPDDRFTKDELHRLPWALCDEICAVADGHVMLPAGHTT